jgi:hypothetical protein
MSFRDFLEGIAYLILVKFPESILFFALGLALIFKPTWFLKSKGETFERKKRNLKFAGMCLLVVSILKAYLAIFPNN